MNKLVVFCVLCAYGAVGCSTVTGPAVSREEIRQASDELQLKALAFRIGQTQRVNAIGYHLVKHIPAGDIKITSRPFLGLFCLERSKLTERFYQHKPEGGVFVAFLLEDTPAAKAGLQPGDVIMSINGSRTSSIRNLIAAVSSLKEDPGATVTLIRSGQTMTKDLAVEHLPIDVHFTVVDDQTVNAAAGPRQVFVTYGLLNFVKSDDEIAAVLGHELAHLSRGHLKRKVGGQFVTAFLAIGLGVVAEVANAGSGNIVMRSVGGIGDMFGAKYSRDLEREADYFGVKYMHGAGYDPQVMLSFYERFAIEIPGSMTRDYFSTHPSSPERKVRVQKAIEELNGPKASAQPNISTAGQ